MSDSLPKGWSQTTIGVIFDFQYGKALPETNRNPEGQYQVFGSNGPIGTHDNYLVQGPGIIIGRKGGAGEIVNSINSFWPIDTTYYVKPPEGIDIKYAYYLLKQAGLQKLEKSTAIPGLNRNDAYQVSITLAPTSEQHRIVAKIEQLFSELDKGVAELKKAREMLALYRQSLLKAAFEGRLTEKWRKKRSDQLETGNQLLDRIRQERDKCYKEQLKDWGKAVDKWETSGKEAKRPTKPRKLKKTILFSAKDLETLPTLPITWKWVTLGELVSGKERSMQSGPFGSNLKHSEFTKKGVLVIGIDNVHDGRFSMGSQNRIPDEKFEELKKYQARPNDLLITVMASIGRTCVIPKDLEKSIITKHVYRISMEEHLLCPEFYNLILQSETVSRKRMFENAQGQTRPGLNSSILWELPVPLCDLNEQRKIVALLSNKLLEIEQIQNTIDNEISKSNVLRQAILKKAFSGKLVPQDPNDESAAELLKRIKADRDEAAKEKKPNRKTLKKGGKRQMAGLLTALRQAGDWISAQEAFRQCGISDGAETDRIEALYIELRGFVNTGKVIVERRGEEDWLKLQATQEAQGAP